MMTKFKKTNWQTKKLGEVCDIFNGLWKGKKPPYIDVSVIRNTNFTKDGFLNNSNIANLPVEVKQYEKRKLKFGDLILEKSGGGPKQPVGRIIIFNKKDGEYSFSNFTSAIRIRNKKELDFNFLHRFLYFQYISGVTETMQRRSTGIRNLQLKEYKQIQIPLPPLPEQKCIVKILDGVFEDVEKAKENAEKNLQNAKELFESYLQSVFENPGKDWEEKSFEEIVESNVIGLVKNKKEQSSDKEYKYVKMNNITRDNSFDFSKYTRVNATPSELKKYSLMRSDFLFNTRNSHELVGKTCIFEGDTEKDIVFNNNIMRVRFTKKINPYFINYAFSSKLIINKVKYFKSGTTNVSAIYYKNLKNLILPIPSLPTQKQIVKKLDELSAQTKKLEKVYQQKIDDLEELKKSILKKAFDGEL